MNTYLKWTEMMWLLIDYTGNDPWPQQTYLGEAGNPSYGRHHVRAMRIGDEVLVDFSYRRLYHTVPASTVVEGFHPNKDGQTLYQLMVEGLIYDYTLTPRD